jgi:hypothetical protein
MPGSSSTLDDMFDEVWTMYADPLKGRVRDRAREIAESDKRTEATAVDAFDALKEFIPGKPVTSLPAQRDGWINRNVTGFIGITAVLTIVFGILGLAPLFSKEFPKEAATGFLEIAKIFAGALVGGAAGAAASRR